LPEYPEENGILHPSGAESGALRTEPVELLPTELTEVVRAWVELPAEIRAAITAVVRASRGG
jgi:hypothetical protein